MDYAYQWHPPFIAPSVDGPRIVYSDGQAHWLNYYERIAFTFGWITAQSIQDKRRPDLAKQLQDNPS